MRIADSIKTGDRVRITMNGEVGKPDSFGIHFKPDGNEIFFWLSGHIVNKSDFKIERLDPPLKVGDMVYWTQGIVKCEIVAIHADTAILWDGQRSYSQYMNELRIAE